MEYYCPRCGSKKIVTYTTSFNCIRCLDNEGFPLEFDMEAFHTIEDKSEILSVREKLAFLKAFEGDFKDPEKRKAFLKSIEEDMEK